MKARSKARRRHKWIIALLILGIVLNLGAERLVDHKLHQFLKNNNKLINLLNLNYKITDIKDDILNLEARIGESVSGSNTGTEVEAQLVKTKIDMKKITISLSGFPRYKKFSDSLDHLVSKKISQVRHVLNDQYPYSPHSADPTESGEWSRAREDIFLLAEQISASIHEDAEKMQDNLTTEGIDTSLFDTAIPYVSDFFFAFLGVLLIRNLSMYDNLFEELRVVTMKEKSAYEAKTRFIINMSHEARTPLNSILGYVGLLRKTPLTDMQQQFTEAIQSSGDDLLNVVTELLDLAKMEEGTMNIKKGPVNLSEIAAHLNDIYKEKFEKKNLGFSINLDTEIKNTILGDAHKLRQILHNLITNALKFTEQGHVSVNSNQTDTTATNVILLFEVVDTGIGIEQEQLSHIFEPFYQVKFQLTLKNSGVGLGLSIVHQLTDLMGGSISLSSEPDKGTEFIVRLPFEIASAQNSPKTTRFAPLIQMPSGAGKRYKILVVEDNALNRDLIVHVLQGWNHEVISTSAARMAMELMGEHAFDLVITDIQMPDIDGYTLAEKIRNELKSKVPIVALTAHAGLTEREKCLKAGMNDYVVKPFSELELFGVLVKFIPVKTLTSKPDFHYLKTISKGNRNFETHILKQFLEQVPDQLKKIKQSILENNFPQVRAILHEVKANTSVLGLEEKLALHLSRIENSKQSQKILLNEYGKIERILIEVRTEIEAMVEDKV